MLEVPLTLLRAAGVPPRGRGLGSASEIRGAVETAQLLPTLLSAPASIKFNGRTTIVRVLSVVSAGFGLTGVLLVDRRQFAQNW